MRIIIADTRPGVRSALELLLKRQPEFEVVDKVASTVALLAAVRAHQPQMVLLDWELARREQAGLIDLLVTVRNNLIIVALSSQPEACESALRAGVNAFISKGDPPDAVLRTLLDIASGPDSDGQDSRHP